MADEQDPFGGGEQEADPFGAPTEDAGGDPFGVSALLFVCL